MNSVNLIPAPRLAAKRRRVHMRRCAVACAAWAVVSVVAAGVAHAMCRQADDPQADERLAAVADEIARTERAIVAVKVQLAAAQSTLRANEAIANQPDWSVLLAMLAKGIRNDVVLMKCHVHPSGAPGTFRPEPRRSPAALSNSSPAGAGAAVAAAEAGPFELEASGYAQTLTAAHRFVGDLEKSGLFARVTLQETKGDAYAGRPAINFRLKCSLDETAATAPPVSAQASVDKQ